MCALLLTFFLLFFQSSQHKPGFGIRKPLANITNTEKLSFQKEPKKTQLKKCAKDEAAIAIEEERCAHNHQCCISLQAKTSTQHLLDTILSLDDESNHLPLLLLYYVMLYRCVSVCLCCSLILSFFPMFSFRISSGAVVSKDTFHHTERIKGATSLVFFFLFFSFCFFPAAELQHSL